MGLSSMSSADLDFEVVDLFATKPDEERRWLRGEEMECREMKGVSPEASLPFARIAPGSEGRTRFARRGVSGGVSRPWTPFTAPELVGSMVLVLSAGFSLRLEKDRRTRRRAIGRLSSMAGLD